MENRLSHHYHHHSDWHWQSNANVDAAANAANEIPLSPDDDTTAESSPGSATVTPE